MNEIKVINHLKQTIRGRYDGEDYEFKPEVPVVLSAEAAAHIFGLGNPDKSQALNMLGFLIPGKATYEEALEKLDSISFFEGHTTFEDDVPETVPARKTGGRPHVSGPGGEQAAG